MCSQSWKSLWVYFRYTHLFSNSDTSAVWLHPLPLLPACISVCVRVCVWAQLLHLCPTLCNPMYFNPSGSSVHGIFPARILVWVAISCSRGSSQPRDQTCVSCIGRWSLYHWTTREALFHYYHIYKHILVKIYSNHSSHFEITCLISSESFVCYRSHFNSIHLPFIEQERGGGKEVK